MLNFVVVVLHFFFLLPICTIAISVVSLQSLNIEGRSCEKVIKKTVKSKRENVKVNGWNFYIFISFMQYLRMIYLKNSLVRAPQHLASLIVSYFFKSFSLIFCFQIAMTFFFLLSCLNPSFYFIISGFETNSGKKL